MQTGTAVGLGVVAVGLVAVTIVAVQSPMSADEEAPIVVKNGSLDIIAGSATDNNWTWETEVGDNEDASPSYSYEPQHKYRDRSKFHWVKVTMQSGTCNPNQPTTSGKAVQVEYTYNPGTGNTTKEVTLKRGASGWFDYRTKVRPSADLTAGTDSTTGRPKLSFTVNGYISRVKVDNWSCTFSDASAQPVLTVCSSDNRKECQ
jgi:hypothetical protein